MSHRKSICPNPNLTSFLDAQSEGIHEISDQYRKLICAEMTAKRISFVDVLPGLLVSEGLSRARLGQKNHSIPDEHDDPLLLVRARQESFRLRLEQGEVAPYLLMSDAAISDCRNLVAATGVADPDVVAREQAKSLLQARESGWNIAMVRAAPLQRVMGRMVSMILLESNSGAGDTALYREYPLGHTPHEEWQTPAPVGEYAAVTDQLKEHIIPEDEMLKTLGV
jgi:hypothetical protein